MPAFTHPQVPIHSECSASDEINFFRCSKPSPLTHSLSGDVPTTPPAGPTTLEAEEMWKEYTKNRSTAPDYFHRLDQKRKSGLWQQIIPSKTMSSTPGSPAYIPLFKDGLRTNYSIVNWSITILRSLHTHKFIITILSHIVLFQQTRKQGTK